MATPDRVARSHRIAPYFEAQLRLASRVAELTGRPLAEATLSYTNLRRRFGLSSAETEAWRGYAQRLEAAPDLPARVEVTRAMFEASPEEAFPLPGQSGFGCFAHEAPVEGRVKLHFVNRDTDEEGGPLAAAKVERRRGELAAMVANIRGRHPDAHTILGASWLYNIEAYRRLFPPEYTATRRIYAGPMRLSGTSSWGQLIDSREAIRPDVRDALIANLAALDPQAPWTAFPYRVLGVSAPVETFARFYGL